MNREDALKLLPTKVSNCSQRLPTPNSFSFVWKGGRVKLLTKGKELLW
jgi:hypothetical protein